MCTQTVTIEKTLETPQGYFRRAATVSIKLWQSRTTKVKTNDKYCVRINVRLARASDISFAQATSVQS